MTDKPIPTEEEIKRAQAWLDESGIPWQCNLVRPLAALLATVRAEGRAEEGDRELAQLVHDAEWCVALWPTNPEGANNVLNPAAGAEWYRMQIAAARTDGEQAGRDAERAEVVSWCLAADGPSRYDGACGTCADGIERGAHHAKG